jgi:hypothetical protein
MVGPATLRWAIDGTFTCTGLSGTNYSGLTYILNLNGQVDIIANFTLAGSAWYTMDLPIIMKNTDFYVGCGLIHGIGTGLNQATADFAIRSVSQVDFGMYNGNNGWTLKVKIQGQAA